MITKLLHQIWNERKQNAWLFLELFVVSLFVWLSIDPVIDLMSRSNIPQNYNDDNVYEICFFLHWDNSPKYNPALADDKYTLEAYRQCLNMINDLPEVETYCIARMYPGKASRFREQCSVDSTQRADKKSVNVDVAYYYSIQALESNYFKTFGIKDAASGKIVESTDIKSTDNTLDAYITETAAMTLFGTKDCIGKEFFASSAPDYLRWRVQGVIKDIQASIYYEYAPTMIVCNKMPTGTGVGALYLGNHTISIKLKEGVDAHKFEQRFRAEIMPKLKAGNLYCAQFTSHKKLKEEGKKNYGINNLYRQNIILTLFALLSGFMGIFGTFWLRASARRRETGIMQSIGATRSGIVRQYATEAVVLASAAFLLALPLIFHKVYTFGFADPLEGYLRFREFETANFLHNQPIQRFATVTVISYLFLVLVSIIGATVPTAATIKRHPADALRE